jgi:hypothetical protein
MFLLIPGIFKQFWATIDQLKSILNQFQSTFDKFKLVKWNPKLLEKTIIFSTHSLTFHPNVIKLHLV